jgi:hypothetical protein
MSGRWLTLQSECPLPPASKRHKARQKGTPLRTLILQSEHRYSARRTYPAPIRGETGRRTRPADITITCRRHVRLMQADSYGSKAHISDMSCARAGAQAAPRGGERGLPGGAREGGRAGGRESGRAREREGERAGGRESGRAGPRVSGGRSLGRLGGGRCRGGMLGGGRWAGGSGGGTLMGPRPRGGGRSPSGRPRGRPVALGGRG